MTQEEQDYQEYQDYLEYLKHPQSARSPSKATAQEPGLMDKTLGAVSSALKPLDYLGGIGRTAAAGAVQGSANLAQKLRALATGAKYVPSDVVKGADVSAALQGNAPTSAEFMKRAGIPEGMKMSDMIPGAYSDSGEGVPLKKGGVLDPSVRGAAGFAADVATDPLTYTGVPAVRGALKGAGKIGEMLDRFLHPVEGLMQAGGKKLYKTAPTMKAVDAVADQFKKGSVSDELFNQGIKGTGRQIAEKSGALAEGIGKERNALLKQADEAGAVLDMKQGMAPAQELVDQITKTRDPNLQPMAQTLEDKIKSYLELTAAPPKTVFQEIKTSLMDKDGNPINFRKPRQELVDMEKIPNVGKPRAAKMELDPGVRGVNATEGSGFKSSLYNDTANSAWDTLRKTPTGAKATKALAKGLDQETTAAVERATGKGADLDALNDRWGKLLTTAKTFEKEAKKGEGKNFITSVDGMLAPFAAHNPALLATKKVTDLLKTNWLKTHGGMGLHNAGQTPGLDEVLRRYLINQGSQK